MKDNNDKKQKKILQIEIDEIVKDGLVVKFIDNPSKQLQSNTIQFIKNNFDELKKRK